MSVKINAQKVRQLRKDLLWSQEDLAAGSGLSLRTVQRIERNSDVSIDTLKAIAAAFNISADDLVLTPGMEGLRIGTMLGFSGAILGGAFAMFGIYNGMLHGEISGHEAGIKAGIIGLVAGLSCAFVGAISYFVDRDMARR